jgi:hypothetical protein
MIRLRLPDGSAQRFDDETTLRQHLAAQAYPKRGLAVSKVKADLYLVETRDQMMARARRQTLEATQLAAKRAAARKAPPAALEATVRDPEASPWSAWATSAIDDVQRRLAQLSQLPADSVRRSRMEIASTLRELGALASDAASAGYADFAAAVDATTSNYLAKVREVGKIATDTAGDAVSSFFGIKPGIAVMVLGLALLLVWGFAPNIATGLGIAGGTGAAALAALGSTNAGVIGAVPSIVRAVSPAGAISAAL